MIKFFCNNTKNINIGYTFFEFNYIYYFCNFYNKDLDLYLKLKITKIFFPNFKK